MLSWDEFGVSWVLRKVLKSLITPIMGPSDRSFSNFESLPLWPIDHSPFTSVTVIERLQSADHRCLGSRRWITSWAFEFLTPIVLRIIFHLQQRSITAPEYKIANGRGPKAENQSIQLTNQKFWLAHYSIKSYCTSHLPGFLSQGRVCWCDFRIECNLSFDWFGLATFESVTIFVGS